MPDDRIFKLRYYPSVTHPKNQSQAWADATLVTDPRFAGGTAQAFISDVHALRTAGLRVGVIFHRSTNFFRDTDQENPHLLALKEFTDVVLNPAQSETVFLHNPQVFGPRQLKGSSQLVLPTCRRMFVVAHHPPLLGNGALCYDPISTNRAIALHRSDSGPVEWLPVSGLVREQLRSFQPFVLLNPIDWTNVFDLTHWTAKREKLVSEQFVIGRHGRPHPDKWPDQAADIQASLPVDDVTTVRLLGAEERFFADKGVDTTGWTLMPFGERPAPEFLDGLDIFSYFHSTVWREAFGRTIAEAMLMGVRCILDPALRPTFGPHALYCAPSETAQVLAHIRNDLASHRAAARAADAWCRSSFDAQHVASRYQSLLSSKSSAAASGIRTAAPLTIARKWIGFHKRQWQMKQASGSFIG